MTYSDIYTKFLIEYDKQNITSSYPSLTVYEIATILDKAYLALIAQKLTGNNPRRAPFEIDIKAIEDLRPLVKTEELLMDDTSLKSSEWEKYNTFSNILPFTIKGDLKKEYLYYVSSYIKVSKLNQYDLNQDGRIDTQDVLKVYEAMRNNTTQSADVNNDNATDTQDVLAIYQAIRQLTDSSTNWQEPITLINHKDMQKFVKSTVNLPWIKTPVACLEGSDMFVMIDPFSIQDNKVYVGPVYLTYIKRPTTFITTEDQTRFDNTNFELNDSMAEELINLAIVMALETVESPRIQMKENTRALES